MTTLHQMYCTHCTYGTAALKREEGPLASEPFGYTVRAASLRGPELAAAYSLVEPYLHYSLPSEFQAGPEIPTIASTPKRLFLARLENGDDLIGHVCYRDTDSSGRPGSYFAHVLLAEHSAGETPLTELDCLRLWGSDWWQETDSRDIQFDLPCLDSLSSAWAPGAGYIDDSLFWEFLNSAPGRELGDSGRLVPSRWLFMTPKERREVFLRVFCAALRVLDEPDSRLVVACEHEVAVLLFYGVVRLLPSLPDRAAYSFSTFESDPDKLSTTLCAVPMADTQRFASARQAFGIAGTVFDTYQADSPTSEDRFSRCAEYLLNKLLAHGWSEVDAIRSSLADRGISTPSDWATTVIDRHQVVDAIFDPDDLAQPRVDRTSAESVGYMRRQSLRILQQYQHPPAQLAFLVNTPRKSPDHLILLDLLCRERDIEEHIGPAVSFLLERLTEHDLAALLSWPEIAFIHRLSALNSFVSTARRLPATTDWLWSSVEREPISHEPCSLLAALLSQLDSATAAILLESIPDTRVSDVLRNPVFADDAKLTVLASFIRRNRCLPRGCEYLWSSDTFDSSSKHPTLLAHVLKAHCDDDQFAAIMAQSPPEAFVALLELDELSKRKRAHVLSIYRYVITRHTLPLFSESLWKLDEHSRPPGDAAIVHAFMRLDASLLCTLHKQLEDKRRLVMVRVLQAAARATKICVLPGTECKVASPRDSFAALEKIVEGLSLPELLEILNEYKSDFVAFYPRNPKPQQLARQMADLIKTIFDAPDDLAVRLSRAGEAHEFLSDKDRKELTLWHDCFSGMRKLSDCLRAPPPRKPSWMSRIARGRMEEWRKETRKWQGSLDDAIGEVSRSYYSLLQRYKCHTDAWSDQERLDRFCALAQRYLRKQFPIDPPHSREAKRAREELRYAFNKGKGIPRTKARRQRSKSRGKWSPLQIAFFTLLFFFLTCGALLGLIRLLLGPDFFPKFDFLQSLWTFRFGIGAPESTARLIRILCRVGT